MAIFRVYMKYDRVINLDKILSNLGVIAHKDGWFNTSNEDVDVVYHRLFIIKGDGLKNVQ